MPISVGAFGSATTKHNMAEDSHNADLTGTDAGVAAFDFHTTELRAHTGTGTVEKSRKPDRLPMSGLT